ncbi:hypothetical protein KCP74_02440 [Salmonella enterica subsp. enterica]|nr:hypothetical protein KCP74_02440 [Salmonella enterica subsp. enterica]
MDFSCLAIMFYGCVDSRFYQWFQAVAGFVDWRAVDFRVYRPPARWRPIKWALGGFADLSNHFCAGGISTSSSTKYVFLSAFMGSARWKQR